MDAETDALIQETIRSSFQDCTTLTIAHRLHTVLASDRIMVLNQGQVRASESQSLVQTLICLKALEVKWVYEGAASVSKVSLV